MPERKARKLRRILWIAGIATAGIVFCAVVAGAWVFVQIVLNRVDGQPGQSPLAQQDHTPIIEGIRWFRTQSPELWQQLAADGQRLQAYYLRADNPSRRTVILAHGYHGQPEEMGALARFYRQEGYHVLLPFARGHFLSGGSYIGFGWLDRKDYSGWVQQIVQREGEKAQIVLHGASMGGATVLMTAGEPLPPQVRAVIDDCGYTTAEEEFAVCLKNDFGLPGFPLLPAGSAFARLCAGYGFAQASALQAVAHTKLPVLIIHGERDSYVPFTMGQRLYAACAGPKRFLPVPDAGHGESYNAARQLYEETVKTFLRDLAEMP